MNPVGKKSVVPARFIVFEGGDGAGKTTQSLELERWLAKQEVAFVSTREPGGTSLAEELRTLALHGQHPPLSELLLMITARADHIQRVIQPALSRGVWVICDRFVDSTLAYQGYGLGIDENLIRRLHTLVCNDLWPDLTVTLDASGVAREQRLIDANDAIEARSNDFQQRVHRGFVELARANPQSHLLIDANNDIQSIHQTIIQNLTERFLIQ